MPRQPKQASAAEGQPSVPLLLVMISLRCLRLPAFLDPDEFAQDQGRDVCVPAGDHPCGSAVEQLCARRSTLERIQVVRWFWNSVFIVVLATAGTLFSASLVAYSFARFDYRGRNVLFFITLATMMLPTQVTLIPQFVLFFKLGWINTLKPLWIPFWFGGGGFAIFLMRQFFLSLPKDLDEAALIDGASYFRIFWSILLPLCKPILATLGHHHDHRDLG